MTESVIRLLLADDHPVVLHGLASLLQRNRDIRVVAEASNGAEAVAAYREQRPDVAVLDLRLPDMSGLEALSQILSIDGAARALILTTFDEDENVYRAIHAGAHGYLLKDTPLDQIVCAVRTVHAGLRYIPAAIGTQLAKRIGDSILTPRETAVLRLAARGNKNKEIAVKLDITEGTVKWYVNNILVKLEARDRTDAVTIALRRGIIEIDPA